MCEIRRPPGQNFFCSLSPSCKLLWVAFAHAVSRDFTIKAWLTFPLGRRVAELEMYVLMCKVSTF